MSETASIFKTIVAGEIPCHRLYEDEHVLSFLDIGPVSRGHCLVIPKKHYVELDDMPADEAAALGAVLPRLVKALKRVTGCDGVNVLQNNGEAAGQVVMHVHFHLIPRYAPAADPAHRDAAPQRAEFGFEWPAGSLSNEDAADLKAGIVAALGDA